MEAFTRALLDRAKSLVGSVLLGVYYDDSPSEGLVRPRLDSGVAHTAHYGVDLICDHGVVGVTSSDEFTDGTNELSLLDGPVEERDGVVDITKMNNESPWNELIGRRIVSSKIHWVDSPYVVLSKRRKAFSSHHYDADGAVPFSGPRAPLALELHFDNKGRVLLVSGAWKGVDEQIVETGRGISVLWDVATFATLVPRIAKELRRSW
jgi:hypothetical protein